MEAIGSLDELRVTEAIGFLLRHPEIGENRAVRGIVMKQLLVPGAIEEHMAAGPDVAEALIEAITTGFLRDSEYLLAMGKIQELAELMEAGQSVLTIAQDVYKRHPHLLTTRAKEKLQEIRKTWNQLIEAQIKPTERARLAADLALSHRFDERLDLAAAKDIVTGLIASNLASFGADDPLWNKEKSAELSEIGRRQAFDISLALGERDRAVLPAVVRTFVPGQVATAFIRDPDGVIYRDEAGEIEINIVTGNIFFRDGRPRSLPTDLRNNTSYGLLFMMPEV